MKTVIDKKYLGYLEDFETPETLAYEQALDFIYAMVDAMQDEGVSKKELAKKMGISQSHLSQLFDVDGSLTLKTMAKFQLALDVRLDFKRVYKSSVRQKGMLVCHDFGNKDTCPATRTDWDSILKRGNDDSRLDVKIQFA